MLFQVLVSINSEHNRDSHAFSISHGLSLAKALGFELTSNSFYLPRLQQATFQFSNWRLVKSHGLSEGKSLCYMPGVILGIFPGKFPKGFKSLSKSLAKSNVSCSVNNYVNR
jgi:hypothetical protein